MSNEKILEELLIEAHCLGFYPEIFKVAEKYNQYSRLDAYQKAFIEMKTKTEVIDINK